MALQEWIDQAENPAVPKGAQQAAGAAYGFESKAPGFEKSSLGQWISESGYNANPNAWYTGANNDGTSNGWDTGFTALAAKQYDETVGALGENPNAFNDWLSRPDATGVVTWGVRREVGDTSEDAKFGDVFNAGKRVGNIYEDFKDPKDANLMIADWMLDAQTKAKIFKDDNRDAWLADEIEAARSTATEQLSKSVGARQFQADVDVKQAELLDAGAGSAAAVASGALTAGMTAAAAAGLGFSWTGPGALFAAAAAGAAASAAAYLNEDQITELGARAIVQSNEAQAEFGDLQGFTTGLAGWSQAGMRLINPLSNATQGIADVLGKGRVGDGAEDFYAIDENGERKAPVWLQVADVGATLGDSLLQFSNPVGLTAYTAGIVGSTVGQGVTLGTTGESFDLRTGEFHDHEGAKENVAAWANLGVDAIQLGMVRGLTAAGRSMQALDPTLAATAAARAPIASRLPGWAGGLKDGEKAVSMYGTRYIVDEATDVAKRRAFSLGIFAPSELTSGVAVGIKTRVAGAGARGATDVTAAKAGKLEADDFYQNALILASGRGSRFGTAMLNGFGEGVEEAAQAMLEPVSMGQDIDPMEVARSFVYGTAAGLGMGLATSIGAPSQSKRLYGRFLQKGLLTGDEMSFEQFEALPVSEQKAFAALSQKEAEATKAGRDALQSMYQFGAVDASTMGVYAVTTGLQSRFEREAARANANITSGLKVGAHSNGDFRNEDGSLEARTTPTWGAEVSAWRAVEEIRKNEVAFEGFVKTLDRELAKAVQDADIAVDEGAKLQAAEEIRRLTVEQGDATAALEMAGVLVDRLMDLYQGVAGAENQSDWADAIDAMNTTIDGAYFGNLDVGGEAIGEDQARALRTAAAVLYSRDPNLESGSFAELMPFVSRELTASKSNSTLNVHQSLLEAPHADHDGDKYRAPRNIVLTRASRNALRTGEQYVVHTQEPGEDGRTREVKRVKIAAPDAEFHMLEKARQSLADSSNPALQVSARHELEVQHRILWNRYAPVVKYPARLRVLLDGLRSDITMGNPAARQIFLDGLATEAYEDIQSFAESNRYPEFPWLSQQITATLAKIQQIAASHKPEYEYKPGTTELVIESTQGAVLQNVHQFEAANMATTMQTLMSGTSSTRSGQGLHYTMYTAAVNLTKPAEQERLAGPRVQQYVAHYEGRSGGVYQASVDQVINRDITIRRVREELDAILKESEVDFGKNSQHALLMLANTKAQDFTYADGEIKWLNSDVTLLQMLLRRSVRIDQAALSQQADRNEDAVNKLKTLEALTYPRNDGTGHGAQAFAAAAEVLYDIPAHTLMGDAAMFLGSSRTLRSLRYELLDLDRESRAERFSALRRKTPYLGRSRSNDPPYSEDEVTAGDLHAYRVFVDMLEAVTNLASGDRQGKSVRTMDKFLTGWAKLGQAKDQFAQTLIADPATRAAWDKASSAERMLQVLNSDQRMQRAFAELIPEAVVTGAFKPSQDGTQVYAAQWLVDMLGMEPEQALMQYWRATTLADYLLSDFSDSDTSAVEIIDQVADDAAQVARGNNSARTFAKLKTGHARQIYLLASRGNPVALAKYLKELNDAQDLVTFRDQVMNNPVYLGNRAPLQPFADDVAEFDETFERSWQPSYPQANQREAIATFEQTAKRYSEDLANRLAVQKSDTYIGGQIESWLLRAQGEDVSVGGDAKQLTLQIAKAVENSQKLGLGVGPGVRDAALATIQSDLVITHNKGQADPAFAAFGSTRVMAEGGGAQPSIDRAIGDVTTKTEKEILDNPGMLAYQSVRIQLNNGATINWVAPEVTKGAGGHSIDRPRPDLLQYARLLKDPTTAGFVKEVLGFTVKEMGLGGNLQTVTYKGANPETQNAMKDILDRGNFSHLFPKPGGRLSVAQADEYISAVQAHIFMQAHGGDADQQTAAFYPIDRMIQEIVTAYVHSSGKTVREGPAAEKMRDDVKVAVAEAIQLLSDQNSLGLLNPGDTDTRAHAVILLVKEKLRERYGTAGAPQIMSGLRSFGERQAVSGLYADAKMAVYTRRDQALSAALAAATNSADRVSIQADIDLNNTEAELFALNLEENLTGNDVDAVMAMYTLSTDPTTAAIQKTSMLKFLGAGRLNYFTDNQTEVWNDVVTAVNSQHFRETGEAPMLTDAHWDVISRAAATAYLSERAGQTSTSVSLKMLEGSKGEWNDVARSFDHTWSYLLHFAMEPMTLNAGKYLADGSGWRSNQTVTKVADQLMYTIFNSKKLGKWSHPIVRLNKTNKDAMFTSPVDLAVAVPGDTPTVESTLIAGTRRDYTFPVEPPSTVVLDAEQLVDPNSQVLIEGRFIRRDGGAMLRYTKADGTEGALDLFDDPELGDTWGDREDAAQATVANSGYVTTTFARMQQAIERALLNATDRNVTQGYSIELVMFDPRDRPTGAQWAHNIFYSGVGREGSRGRRDSLIAELIYASEGVYQDRTQEPLEALNAGHAAFTPTPAIDLALVLDIEDSGDLVYDQLVSKARLIVGREFDFGRLQTADFNAIMEWLRARHMVQVADGIGGTQLVSVDEVIADQRQPQPAYSDIRLVPLSDKTMMAIMGDTTGRGNRMVPPNLNQRATSAYTEYTPARLDEVGITALGESADIRTAGFQHRNLVTSVERPRNRMNQKGGLAQAKIVKATGQQASVFEARTSQTGFDAKANAKTAKPYIEQALGAGSRSVILAGLGLPQITGEAGATNQVLAETIIRDIEARMQERGSSTNTHYVHRQGVAQDLTQGYLSEASFNPKSEAWLTTLGDNVYILLDNFEDLIVQGMSYDSAKDQLLMVVQKYADTSTNIHLISGRARRSLRDDAREYLLASANYSGLSQTSYVPVFDELGESQTQRAMERTLVETRGVSRQGLRLEFASDYFTPINEQQSFWNTAADQSTWPIMRSNILSSRPSGYGELVTERQREVAKAKVKALLNTEEGFAHAVKMAGKGEGIPQALDKLKSQLNADKWPTDVGETFGFGHFDVLIGPDDTVYLGRQGFKRMTAKEVRYQANIAVGETLPEGGVAGTGVAIGQSDRDDTLTTNTGVIVEVSPTALGGGRKVLYRIDVNAIGGKGIGDRDGYKHGFVDMPRGVALPTSNVAGDMQFSAVSGLKSIQGKESFFGLANNFRNAFMALGVDFHSDMIEFITGTRPTAETFTEQWAITEQALQAISESGFGLSASDVATALRSNSFFEGYSTMLTTRLVDELQLDDALTNWIGTPDREQTPNQRLGTLFVAALMTPEVKLEHLISTRGIADIPENSTDRARMFPQVFTDALDDYSNHPDLRNMLFDRFNERWPADENGERDYFLANNWDFVVKIDDNGVNRFVKGRLKVSDLQLDDDHPELLTQSERANTRAGVSIHAAAQANALFGSIVASEREFTSLPKAELAEIDLWNALQSAAEAGLPQIDRSITEQGYATRATRRHALYRTPLITADYSDKGARYRQESVGISRTLFGDEIHQDVVDYLVRMLLGARGQDPEVTTELTGVDMVDEHVAYAALELIRENLEQGFFPTFGSITSPLIDFQVLENILTAQKGRQNPWMPVAAVGNKSVYAKQDRASWIHAALGQMQESDAEFDPAFRLDLDGAWLTYEGALKELENLPVSTSPLVSMKLLDPATQKFAVSLDPKTQTELASVMGMEGTRITMDTFLLGDSAYGRATASQVTASAISKRLKRLKNWHSENRTGPVKKGKVKDYLQEGAWYSKRATGTHHILRDLTNLRLGLALFNPALMVAAIPEAMLRNSLEGAVSLLTGTATGSLGRTVSRAGEATGMWTPHWSVEQQAMIENLQQSLGDNPQFMSMVYDELLYAHHAEPGDRWLGKLLENFAKVGARHQDPTWGQFAKSVAKRYIESALAYVEFDPTNVISVEQLVSNLNDNPLWLKDISPERGISAHSSGLNAIAQVRSTRANIIGKSIRGVYEPLSENPNAGVAFVGHLLKWPLIFTNYTTGAAMFLTGTSGIADFAAAYTHGRSNGPLGRIQAAMRGQQYNPAEDSTFDNSDILEGIDLTRSFLRSGITWSGYMAYMLMGGAGLSGEDAEARRRRLLTTYYGAPLQYDPRAAQNDWRNAQTVFLDALPGPLASIGSFFARPDGEGGATKQMMPHWIVRQFISPLVGIERFMATGDIRQIKWGFQDAVSVMPNSVLRTWDDFQDSADELTRMAENEALVGTEESMANTNRLLIQVVGMYERAFLESSFVNTIRNGSDTYDRDPWVQVRTDKHGEIERDNMGNPLPTDALITFKDGQEVRQGYASRGYWDAQLHQYAENNATFAGIAAFFTGFGDSDYLRRNMAVKEREVSLKPSTEEEARGMFLKAFDQLGGIPTMSTSEMVGKLRNELHEKTGRWASTAELTPIALSMMSDGREILTKDGSRAIFESVYKGAVDLSNPVFAGTFVTVEMRKEIQRDIVDDLIAEGISWGMDEQTAKYRANRIWWGGGTETPDQVGLRSIVWSEDIPFQPTQKYNQLNTTYVLGPGGRPFATGVRRDSWLEALGINPLGTGMTANTERGMSVDGRLNSTDLVRNINTGLRALERKESEELKPDDAGFKKSLNKPYAKTESNGGYSGYRRSGGYGGGGGGYYNGGYANFTKMYALPDQRTVYGNSVPFINTSTPIIRRSVVRRERVWSERGRLKQWQ